MTKEEKLIFRRVFLIVVAIFLVNGGMFLSGYGFNKELTGLTIKDSVVEAYTSISPASKIFLITQWILLLLVLLFVYAKDKGVKNTKNELQNINLEKMSEKRGTDLDTLYNILKDRKQLRISAISKIFRISKEVAMNWCKILESSNLVIIEYPSTKEPIVRIIG